MAAKVHGKRDYCTLLGLNGFDGIPCVGVKRMDNGITGDFVAMDIRQVLYYLGEITVRLQQTTY